MTDPGTIAARTPVPSFTDYIMNRRATPEGAADPAVCFLADAAVSRALPADLSWRDLRACVESRAPEHAPAARRVWDDFLRASVSVHPVQDGDPRVREARRDWRNEDTFACVTCERRHHADDEALTAAGETLFDAMGRQLHEDEPDLTLNDADREVLCAVGEPFGVCKRCSIYTDEQVIEARMALQRRYDDGVLVPALDYSDF